MREPMDKWKNTTAQTLVIDLSESAQPFFPGQPLVAVERFVTIKPGETVEIEAAHRRAIWDEWCPTCKKPAANEKVPARVPRSVCSNPQHGKHVQGGQGALLTRVRDDGVDVPQPPLAIGLAAPWKDEAAPVRTGPVDPDEILLTKAREAIAKRNSVQ